MSFTARSATARSAMRRWGWCAAPSRPSVRTAGRRRPATSPRPASGQEIGTLEAGKRADVVIARGNPLTDIHALGDPANILLVMKDGVAYKDLDGLAARSSVPVSVSPITL